MSQQHDMTWPAVQRITYFLLALLLFLSIYYLLLLSVFLNFYLCMYMYRGVCVCARAT